jgi:hypothetical protein
MGTSTVGSMLGMISNYFSQHKPQDSMKPEFHSKQKITYYLSSISLKEKINSELSVAKAKDNEIKDVFLNSL